jgi:hypothetical protein
LFFCDSLETMLVGTMIPLEECRMAEFRSSPYQREGFLRGGFRSSAYHQALLPAARRTG